MDKYGWLRNFLMISNLMTVGKILLTRQERWTFLRKIISAFPKWGLRCGRMRFVPEIPRIEDMIEKDEKKFVIYTMIL